MKESEYYTSENEPYVFKVNRPGDLVGAHVDLMSSALQPREHL